MGVVSVNTNNENPGIKILCENLSRNSAIDRNLYEKFNVKRGLRNMDGTSRYRPYFIEVRGSYLPRLVQAAPFGQRNSAHSVAVLGGGQPYALAEDHGKFAGAVVPHPSGDLHHAEVL